MTAEALRVTAEAPFRDPRLPAAERVSDLISRMTLEEKIGQMLQLDARTDLSDAILTRQAGSLLHASRAQVEQANRLLSQTRLRIPLLIGEDCIHGHSFWRGATIYPTQLGMASSWDAGLIERVARATAVEASATGAHWTFSPVLCIAQDLRWGRVDETFGEDPFLIGELASAMVRGYQGAGLDDPTAILASAKHFAGYSETQGGRDASEADLSRRKLRSWFLPPFERVAREGCRTFMLGYQTMDGVPITLNEWLINDVLKDEWGFEGTLVTDWDNVGRMVWEQRVQPDITHAAAAAVRAGNDVIMTTPDFSEGARDAVARGLLRSDAFDDAVSRILRLKIDLGLFEDPRLPSDERMEILGSPPHAELNLEVARRSVVLLENDGVLPLDRTTRVAVTGPLADDAQYQLGDWAGASGQGQPDDEHPRQMITTVLDGIRRAAPAGVSFARGADILTLEPDPEGAVFPDGQPRPPVVHPCAPDDAMIAAAVADAENADVVVAVVGDHIELVGEGRSTATLELIGGQNALLDALIATSTPVVVVLLASKPLVLPPSVTAAAAVLWIANPGMDAAHGVGYPHGRRHRAQHGHTAGA